MATGLGIFSLVRIMWHFVLPCQMFLHVKVLKPLSTNSDDLSHLRLASTFSSSMTTRQDIAATEHTRITTLFTGEGK